MKINVLNRSNNELRIELVGESHSFCNVIQSVLIKDDSIEYVGYNISHPLVSQPVMYIRTNGQKPPEDALIEAAKTVEKELSVIKKTLQKTFKPKD